MEKDKDNKVNQIAPDDLIADQVDQHNRDAFLKKAKKEIGEGNPVEKDEKVLERQVEKYRDSFRNYYYTSQILNDTKNHDFFDQTIKEVHSGVKIKAPSKNILRLVNKVFVQEIAQTCFEIMQKSGAQDVDQEVIEDAFRLIQKRKAKINKFGKLFRGS